VATRVWRDDRRPNNFAPRYRTSRHQSTSQFFTTPQNFCTRLLPKIKVLSFFECKQTSVLLFSLPCAIYFAYMVSRSAQDYNMYNDRGCQNITADLEEFWADIPTATGLYRRNISLQANEWICYVMYVLF
jgi:hypothetical protein